MIPCLIRIACVDVMPTNLLISCRYTTGIQELLQDYPGTAVLHPHDKRGCQLVAEQLSLCYHYNLHGFYGKEPPYNVGEDFEHAVPPNEHKYLQDYRIRMHYGFYPQDGNDKIVNLADNVFEDEHECDPLAKMIAAAGEKRFRFRIGYDEVGGQQSASASAARQSESDAFAYDVTLFYLPQSHDGEESYNEFFTRPEDQGAESRPLTLDGQLADMLVFWEGRHIPFASFQLPHATPHNYIFNLKTVPKDMKRRIRGVVHVSSRSSSEGAPLQPSISKVKRDGRLLLHLTVDCSPCPGLGLVQRGTVGRRTRLILYA